MPFRFATREGGLRLVDARAAMGGGVTLEFAGLPALYKLYVIQDLTRPDEPLEEEACKEFLRELLPELEKCFRA